jgi:hypothetical protein
MPYAAFSGFEHIASGTLPQVYAASRALDQVIIIDVETGRVVDIDPRVPPAVEEGPRPGRPRLGVTAREITLLPRHWDWLAAQPGGASVTLRKLVEQASRNPRARQRSLRDAAYRFATTLAGDAPGYEEAIRALYAGDRDEFMAHIEGWPGDVRAQLESMTAEAFA